MEVSNELITWLASGERGVSSNTMVTHLTGIPAENFMLSNPWDPDDLHRCRLLLEQVPELQPQLPRMATLSPQWAALVAHWQELCDLMDSEAPAWRGGMGRAPATYVRMRELLDGARAKAVE